MVPDVALPAELRHHVDRARNYAARLTHLAAAHPAAPTGILALLLLGYAAYRLFAPLPPGVWPELKDSVIFEYGGWYVSQGNRLYLDFWELKPPLAFEVTAVLALLAGDSVVRYHVLNLLANAGAIAVAAAAAAGIVHELTDDPLAAVVGGLTTFALPYYFYRALIGFKSKYFVVAAGLACLYLAYRERPVAAGVAGAAAVGFWQLALVFPLGGFGLLWHADRRARSGVDADETGETERTRGSGMIGGAGTTGGTGGTGCGRGAALTRRFLGAALVTSAVVLLPVVLWGAVPAMIAEVLFAPLIVTEGHTFTDRMQYIVRLLGKTLPLALLGLAGVTAGLLPGRLRREWPLALTVGWFTVAIVAFDLDRQPDLFPWFAVVAVGVGLVVGHGRRSPGSRLLAVAVLAMVVLSVGTMGGYGTGTTGLTSPDTYDTATELDPGISGARALDATERQYVYWSRVEIRNCRAFGAYTQFQLVLELELADDRPWHQVPCGQFEPAWQAVRDEYGR